MWCFFDLSEAMCQLRKAEVSGTVEVEESKDVKYFCLKNIKQIQTVPFMNAEKDN